MNVGWIAPLNKKCGIAFYARRYADALSGHVRIIESDPDDFCRNRKDFLERMSGCDCVHIQYETSFFLNGRLDFYPELCRKIQGKKIVTLHEVYRRIPSVFPRENIKGTWPLKAIKEIVWDLKHPHWALFTKHLHTSFFADAIIVHSQFQKEILIEKGVDKEKINVVPLPIKVRPEAKVRPWNNALTIELGATGFINPSYDYDLLFKVLECIDRDWRFFWVGGLRRNDDAGLLRWLEQEIEKRGWKQRFTITGWVSDDERDRRLDEMHVFCAFFKDRSSSESLADAIAAKKLIIAGRIPLTEEIAGHGPVLVLAQQEPEAIAQTIWQSLSDKTLLQSIERAQVRYGETYSYAECAKIVVDLYEKVANNRSTASTSPHP
jgi:glycosyltransferase involved in cell wall biosynthesis